MKNKYNIIIIILVFLIIGLGIYLVISMNKKTPTISYNQTTITMRIGDTKKIEPVVTDLDNYVLEWVSSNIDVVTVNEGVIEGISKGTATITVKIKDYDVSLSINIIVNDIEIESIKLDKNNLELVEGDTSKLEYTIIPNNATNRTISWDISNKDIISFNDGEIKAIKPGTTTITIKTYNGFSDKCDITIKEKIIEVSEIKVDKDNYNLYIGDSVTINPIVLPNNATNKELTYSSSDNSVAIINEKTIKGLKVGTATITLKSNNNIKKEIKIVVKKKPIEFRVASINIGAYHCGTSSTSCTASPQSFTNLFREYKVNIVGMQESEPESKTKQIPTLSGLTSYYYIKPASSNTILSNYKFISKETFKLPSCGEDRVIQKVVINVNDIDISFYNSHFSYQTRCHDTHFNAAADILKKDKNPTIMLGDLNINAKSYYEKYFEPLGFKIAAYDTSSNNLHKGPTYCNSIYVKGNGHITIKEGKHIDTFGKYTDHNMTFAILEIS
ncbi:MAG: Ig-like domain-containing protein [Bacilli bacterium]|nr:Ig-like domain-containing protein [Bacilli bacterium]